MEYFKSRILCLCIVMTIGILIDSAVSIDTVYFQNDAECVCSPQQQKFNDSISGEVKGDCPKCYKFTYNFTENQEWAANLCVQSKKASIKYPLFVVVRESVNVMSFQVPVTFPGVSPYSDVCRTLCPLANYKDAKPKEGVQNIMIEISTSSESSIDFNLMLSKVDDFLITNRTMTVDITPSKPRIMQYNMEEDLRAVRIEAISKDDSCMVLAIQGIKCPIYDSVESVEPQGYYQTLTRQSGISITRKTFEGGRQYIVLLLKPTDESCIETNEETKTISENRNKKVTVRVVPSITNEEYYEAVFGAFGFYVLIYIFSFIICCFLFVKQRRSGPELENVNVENPSIQNYGTSSESESASEHSNVRSLRDFPIPPNHSPISFDETDMDKLPDAEVDKNIVRTKTIVFVSDLARKKDKYLSDRTKVYSWNLLTIAIFYGLPVIQLVYINQRIVNLTGNQDLCYYNFLCSHQVGVFSDFNHVYSNIGYVMLGILFLLLVWRRDVLDKSYEIFKEKKAQNEILHLCM